MTWKPTKRPIDQGLRQSLIEEADQGVKDAKASGRPDQLAKAEKHLKAMEKLNHAY